MQNCIKSRLQGRWMTYEDGSLLLGSILQQKFVLKFSSYFDQLLCSLNISLPWQLCCFVANWLIVFLDHQYQFKQLPHVRQHFFTFYVSSLFFVLKPYTCHGSCSLTAHCVYTLCKKANNPLLSMKWNLHKTKTRPLTNKNWN